jgi:hypothetical protein
LERELFRLPLFLQLCEVLIYTVAKKMLDANNLTPIQARLLAQRGDRIRKNQRIVDLRPVLGRFELGSSWMLPTLRRAPEPLDRPTPGSAMLLRASLEPSLITN